MRRIFFPFNTRIQFLLLALFIVNILLITLFIQQQMHLRGEASELPIYNVKEYGVKGDGISDDATAINAAQSIIASTGGVLYFPAGTYTIGGNGIVLRKSNIVFRGDGKDTTIFKRGGTTGNIFVSSPSFPGLTNVTIENLTLDRNGRSFPGYQPSVVLYGTNITGVKISQVRFWDSPSLNLALSGMDGVTVENSEFLGRGDSSGSGISMSNGTKNTVIRSNTFSYLSDGISLGTLQGQYQSTGIVVENNTIDLGWWLVKSKMTGEGSSVSYTNTSVTDTSADFTPLFPLATNTVSYNVRVMPIRHQGSGQYTAATLTDTSAQFQSKGIIKGEIIRTASSFAVVEEVLSDSQLKIEKWIDFQEYTTVSPPSDGTNYTVYGVYIGKLSQIYGTSTTNSLKTQRWHDLNGNSVTPPNGSLYEVLVKRPNYPLHFEIGTSGTMIRNNAFIRGWSDQISHYGTNATITGNTVKDGQDVGITFHGTNNIVTGNTIIHQGSVGIWTHGDDNQIKDNVITDMTYENYVNTISLGCIAIEGGERNLIENNKCNRNPQQNPLGRYGYVIQGVQYTGSSIYGDAVDNILKNNTSQPHTVADYYIFGRNGGAARGTILENNTGTVKDEGVGTILITPIPTPTPTLTPTSIPTPSFTPTPTITPTALPTATPSPQTITIYPTDDAYVRSDVARRNYGSVSSLGTDGSPIRYSYLLFNTSSYVGKKLISAKLQLRSGSDTSSATQSLKPVINTSWSESTITYANRPEISSSTLATFIGNKSGNWYDLTLTSYMSTRLGQKVSFAITSSNSDSLSMYSSESSSKPILILVLQ